MKNNQVVRTLPPEQINLEPTYQLVLRENHFKVTWLGSCSVVLSA